MSHTYSPAYDKAKEGLDELQKMVVSNPSKDVAIELMQLTWLFANAAKWANSMLVNREKFTTSDLFDDLINDK
ncbi:hypothetical protein KBA63_00205 [Candidatus Woesebacteria bacterium]|nr:hypothetical protein [Candidatus Woesebacteria bacterium]